MTKRIIKKTIVFSAGILLIAGAGFFFLVSPLLTNISAHKLDLVQAQQSLTRYEADINSLYRASKDQKNSEETFSKINMLWPDDKNVSAFVIALESLASGENITIANIAMSEPSVANTKSKKTVKVNKVQFTFEAEGSYDKAANLVQKLETFSRFTSVNEINLIAKDDGNVTLKVSGNIFYGK